MASVACTGEVSSSAGAADRQLLTPLEILEPNVGDPSPHAAVEGVEIKRNTHESDAAGLKKEAPLCLRGISAVITLTVLLGEEIGPERIVLNGAAVFSCSSVALSSLARVACVSKPGLAGGASVSKSCCTVSASLFKSNDVGFSAGLGRRDFGLAEGLLLR